MQQKTLSVPEQIKIALDGRPQRWLSFEVKIPESDLSKKMNGILSFTQEEIDKINTRLSAKIIKG